MISNINSHHHHHTVHPIYDYRFQLFLIDESYLSYWQEKYARNSGSGRPPSTARASPPQLAGGCQLSRRGEPNGGQTHSRIQFHYSAIFPFVHLPVNGTRARLHHSSLGTLDFTVAHFLLASPGWPSILCAASSTSPRPTGHWPLPTAHCWLLPRRSPASFFFLAAFRILGCRSRWSGSSVATGEVERNPTGRRRKPSRQIVADRGLGTANFPNKSILRSLSSFFPSVPLLLPSFAV